MKKEERTLKIQKQDEFVQKELRRKKIQRMRIFAIKKQGKQGVFWRLKLKK